jgi:probable HAF family extracellular repeat protein
MKRIAPLSVIGCLGLLFAASACFAQMMYTVTDLGTGGGTWSLAYGINASGQVVGDFNFNPFDPRYFGGEYAFRTAPNSPINGATDNLKRDGEGGFFNSEAYGINASGQVVGRGYNFIEDANWGFRTDPNGPITFDSLLGGLVLNGNETWAYGINDSGQVVGFSILRWRFGALHAFRTAPNSPINPATDDLGTLGGTGSVAYGINASGQVVGSASITGDTASHAFRTAPNSPINPATDDLGPGVAYAINDSGQVAGGCNVCLPGVAINNFGQTVGGSSLYAGAPFVYNGSVMHDLNNLIPTGSGCVLSAATGINDAGQIAGNGNCSGQTHTVRLDPIYEANVQSPINADGSSVFRANRGALPVKFTLTQYGAPTCVLLPATIAVTRTTPGTFGSVAESVYSTPADNGFNFTIDATACQYVYNLAASSLGVGTYRVDISINGIAVGHAVFALE